MTYTEILNSDLSKSKNVIYKFTNLVNNISIHLGLLKQNGKIQSIEKGIKIVEQIILKL